MDIKALSCTCKRWDHNGIPCHHSVVCCKDERIEPEDLVDKCYSIASFLKAYQPIIMPDRDEREWEKMHGPVIKPPPKKNDKKGRHQKNRRKQPHEAKDKRGGKKLTRHGVVITCSHCQEEGHNRAGCNKRKAGLPPVRHVPQPQPIPPIPVDSSDDEQQNVHQVEVDSGSEESEEEPVITQVCLP